MDYLMETSPYHQALLLWGLSKCQEEEEVKPELVQAMEYLAAVRISLLNVVTGIDHRAIMAIEGPRGGVEARQPGWDPGSSGRGMGEGSGGVRCSGYCHGGYGEVGGVDGECGASPHGDQPVGHPVGVGPGKRSSGYLHVGGRVGEDG